eukprot:CAMPEP_0118812036 /NCGR_PEP_ID=MMETSP1162-20130426/2050_1 /TAXON_ID=33656 /ORGANISM="Phaeocystis Sp, Strain CCMP2710" /LENGTH=297 /DNA_ID=CAMNT_0006741727 /DNA_START=50 /DNA_END=940 /DNA_ORIENTATION=+
MALSKLSGDLQRIIFRKLCVFAEIGDTRLALYPGDAVAFSSASSELRALTKVELLELLQVRKAWVEVVRKAGKRSYKKLSHAKSLQCIRTGVSADDLATLGTLCGILPKLQDLRLIEPAADGVQWLAEKLGAGALPAVTLLRLGGMHVGDSGATALAAALGRGALPRLKTLQLNWAAIGDEGLIALAPALRRLPALETLNLSGNPFGDAGLHALVAPLPAGAPPPIGALAELKVLYLGNTGITDAGCTAIVAALDSGVLPALEELGLRCRFLPGAGPVASAATRAALQLRVNRVTVG